MLSEQDALTLPQEIEVVASACLENAEDLVSSAELLLENSKPHIAFHLAVLALEEIGKRDIIVLNGMARHRERPEVISVRKLDDHVGKLFWALFFQIIFREHIDEKKVDEIRGLSKFLHERRLEALYVETERTPFISPRDVLPIEEVKNMVAFTRNHLDMERCYVPAPLTPEQSSRIAWFLQASSDEQFRTFMFGGASMTKLREFGKFPQWVDWLLEQETTARESFTALVETERKRAQTNSLEGRPRWRFKIRLAGLSHSLRQNDLNLWNERVEAIKFNIVKTKGAQELSITLTLPDKVTIDGLYPAGRVMIEKILLALNISTMGFFWWETPDHTARYMEKLEDLDSHQQITLSETPELKINWEVRSLSYQDLALTGRTFAKLPHFSTETFAPFAAYLEGLSFLATINVFRRHESYAFRCFYDAYWAALKVYGLHTGERTEQAFIMAMPEPVRDDERLMGLYNKGAILSLYPPRPVQVTLEDVAWMKHVVDAYLVIQVNQQQPNIHPDQTEDSK